MKLKKRNWICVLFGHKPRPLFGGAYGWIQPPKDCIRCGEDLEEDKE